MLFGISHFKKTGVCCHDPDSSLLIMADVIKTREGVPDTKPTDCEDVEKMLMVIVKRRKTIPTKCLDINKDISTNELLLLENAKVITEEYKEKEKFKRIVHGFKRLKSFHFTLDDINEAEQKLDKYYKRIKEINCYLEKRKKLLK